MKYAHLSATDSVIVVSRHPAAIEFIRAELHTVLKPMCNMFYIEKATAEDVSGKIVVGNLPMHLAAKCEMIYAIEFEGEPPRGREYTAEDMKAAGAKLVPYRVEEVG